MNTMNKTDKQELDELRAYKRKTTWQIIRLENKIDCYERYLVRNNHMLEDLSAEIRELELEEYYQNDDD